MSDVKPIQDVFYPNGGRRRGRARSNEIDDIRDMNRSLLGQLDEARADLSAAIQRGDTYRARARALRRQAKAWRITYRIMSDISCSVDPGSTRNIKRAMRLP